MKASLCVQLLAGADLCEADDVADCIWILHEGIIAEVDANDIEAHERFAPTPLGETAQRVSLGPRMSSLMTSQ